MDVDMVGTVWMASILKQRTGSTNEVIKRELTKRTPEEG